MSNGQPNPNNPGQHVWLRDGSMISHEEYARNARLLAEYRDRLTRMEQENEQAYRRYTMAEQELQNRVAQGREAERILAQIRSSPAQVASVPLLTNASHPRTNLANGHITGSQTNDSYVTTPVGEQPGEFVQGTSQPQATVSQYAPHTSSSYTSSARTSYDSQQYPPYHPQARGSASNAAQGRATGQQAYPQPPHGSSTTHSQGHYAPTWQAYGSTMAVPTHDHSFVYVQHPSGTAGEARRRNASEPQATIQQTSQVQDTGALQRQAVVAESRIYDAVKELPLLSVDLILRVVLKRKKRQHENLGSSVVEVPDPDENGLSPVQMVICDKIVEYLVDLPSGHVIYILRRVHTRIGDMAKGSVPQPLAIPAAGEQTTQARSSSTRPATPSDIPIFTTVPRPISTPPAQYNQAQQPPTAVNLEEANGAPLTNGPSTPDHAAATGSATAPQTSAPSVSFSNLAPSTPQQNGVGPSFTPGRLAHDILKSLGRPTGRTLNAIPSTTVVPDGTKDNQAKRRLSASSADSMGKRQKTSAPVQPPIDTVDSPPSSSMPMTPQEITTPAEFALQGEQSLATKEPVDAPVIEELEEIHTPGAIESALNEAVAALNRNAPSQEHGPPLRDAPPLMDSGISLSSTALQSDASLPPSSKVSTPEPEVSSQPEVDVDMEDAPAQPKTPVAGPSKQLLFYVSPTASNEDLDVRPDFDEPMSDFLPSGLLANGAQSSPGKGKQRASVARSEVVVVGSSDSDDRPLAPPPKTGKRAVAKRRRQAYVLAPPPSEALQNLQRAHAGKKGKLQHGNKVVGRMVVSSDEESDDVDEIAEDFRDEATQLKEAAEARVVQDLCYTRHKACNCRWNGCTAVLESAKRLGVHARGHAFDLADADIYPCSWEGCHREYKSKKRLAHHVQKHSLHPVTCAYAGCDFECWAARDMVMHHKQPRHRGQPLKPDAGPIPPDLTVEPPPLPETLPSYMTVPRPIRPARISAERHATLAPRIAANISTWSPFGEVSESTTLRTPRRPKLSDKRTASLESGEAGSASTAKSSAGKRPVRGPYDYWLEPAALHRVRRLCDDIPSKAVTDMFSNGLVIDSDWLTRGDPGWEFHEQDADGVTDMGEEDELLPEDISRLELADDGGDEKAAKNVLDSHARMGPAGDGTSVVAEEREELQVLRTLADGASPQPGWEVLPDASEEVQ